MWCRSCRQDVPGLVDGQDGRYACPRCSAVLLADGGVDLTAASPAAAAPTSLPSREPSAYAAHEPDPYESPLFEPVRPAVTEASRVTTLRWDAANWELNEKLRHVERVTASSRLRFDSRASAAMPSPHGPWNPPHAATYGTPYSPAPAHGAQPYSVPHAASAYAAPPQPSGPFAPAPYPEPAAPQQPAHYEWNTAPPSSSRPEDHWDTPVEIFASLTMWFFMGTAIIAFSCGGFLAAWGGIAGRPELQNMGMPVIIVGVGLLVVGLLPRIFLNRIEEEDRRKLEQAARAQTTRETAAPHFARPNRPAAHERTPI